MNTFIILIGCLLIVAGIIVSIVSSAKSVAYEQRFGTTAKKPKNKLSIPMIIIGIALIIFGNSFVIVPTGYTGVRSTFGQISDSVVPHGMSFKTPFVEKIVLVNNKQQDTTINSKVWGETKEKTPVYASDIVVTYQVSESKSAWLYANVSDVRNLIDDKIVSSSLKSAMIELTVETVTNRSYIEPLAAEKLQAALDEKYGEFTIVVKQVILNDMDFEESYNAAIAEKSIALQNQQRQAIENETAIAKAEADKMVAITNAEAEAETKKIEAQAAADALLIEAEAEAEANRKLSESLTDEIIKNKMADKWNGQVPVVNGNGESILDISGLIS